MIDTGPRAAANPLRNLVIVHTSGVQDLSDWQEVKSRIDQWAPDIEVRIADNRAPDSAVADWQISRPSLVFSPHRLIEYRPKGGTIFAGALLSKLEQIERIAGKGLPVPPTLKLTRNLDLSGWGEYLIAKPQYGFNGIGVCLVKRHDLAHRYGELTLDGTRDMIVQPYIEHSENGCPTDYRVLTLFGNVIYSARSCWGVPRRELADIASDAEGIIASNNRKYNSVRQVWNDPEVIGLGEGVHAAFPERPVLGIDIVREVGTGKLYVLEANPIGPWHLSSNFAKQFSSKLTRDFYAQFGALDRTARLLIERTRAQAA